MHLRNILLSIIIVIIIIFIIVYNYDRRVVSVVATSDHHPWKVVASYDNREDAANMLSDMNAKFNEFLRYLAAKYNINEYKIDPVTGDCNCDDVHNIVSNILTRYNPNSIYENDPRFTSDTSFNIDKGRRIAMCLRNKEYPHKLVDPQVLMFVLLHEVGGHSGNYRNFGHQTRFWEVFKFVLHEAVACGIYTPVSYGKYPVMYCGLKIDYQPLDDNTLKNLWMT